MNFDKHLKEDCWQDMERSKKMTKLVNDKLLTDCEFLVGPEDSTAEKFSGHKLMFVMESPVFESMMIGNFAEAAKNQVIRIKDVFPQAFKNFRDLIYCNDYEKYSKFLLSEIFEIYRIADKYLVSSISRDCIKYLVSIKESLDIRQLLMSFEFAFEIKDGCLQTHIEKVISTRNVRDMLNDKINEFSPELFYEYMVFLNKLSMFKPKTNNSNSPTTHDSYGRIITNKQEVITESALSSAWIFYAIHTYFKNNHLVEHEGILKMAELEETSNSETEKGDLQDKENNIKKKTEIQKYESLEKEETFNITTFKRKLLKLVKFDEMSTDGFINGPGKSSLLNADEKYKWLAHICTKTKK